MLYCPSCLEEYRDDVATCPDCGQNLIGEAEIEKLPQFHHKQGVTTSEFVRVAAVDDQFDSAALCDALEAEGIPVLARPRRPVETLPTGTTRAWWEILVPEELAARAKPLIDKRLEDLREAEKDAEAAAEKEAVGGKGPEGQTS